jgi:ABC-type uncharacterized transport system permease subunit
MDLLLLRLTLALYAAATAAAAATVLGRRRRWAVALPYLIGAACAAHLGAIMARVAATGLCPLHTSGDIVSFVTLAGVLIYLAGFYQRGLQALSIFLLPLALALTIASRFLPQVAPALGEEGMRRLLVTHVGLSALGTAALSLTFAGSLLYLWQERALKTKGGARILSLRLPALERLDGLVFHTLSAGFALMTLALITGGMWEAHAVVPAPQRWQERETLALVAWAIFGAIIIARLAAGWRGRRSAYLTLAGVAALLLRMLGVGL